MNKGQLGSAIGLNTTADRAPTHLQAMTSNIKDITQNALRLEARLQNLLDRAYGAQPEDPRVEGKDCIKAGGATAELSDSVNHLSAVISRTHNLFDRLESLV